MEYEDEYTFTLEDRSEEQRENEREERIEWAFELAARATQINPGDSQAVINKMLKLREVYFHENLQYLR